MVPAPNYLVYLAYGPTELAGELVYSLASYYEKAAKPVQVLIYTNFPNYFTQLLGFREGITYPLIRADEWQQWRGASNKVYLLKVGVLAHAARHYPGNLLFVDNDTIWQVDPAPLFAQLALGQRVMHVSEGTLAAGNELSRKVYRHLRKHVFTAGPHQIRVTNQTVLYNSGVLGFASPVAAQLPEVMELADQLYAAYDKHMMEQLAFSLRFEFGSSIMEAAPYVIHYWNLKVVRPKLFKLVDACSGCSLSEIYHRAEQLNLPSLHLAEMRYRSLTGWRRMLLKALGAGWEKQYKLL